MSARGDKRVAVLARIRSALGVSGEDPTRRAAVQDRLARHPRGTIPARAKVSASALRDTLSAMLMSQGAVVKFVARPQDVVGAIKAELAGAGLPLALRIGTDVVLAELPWTSESALALEHGPASMEDRAALSRAAVAAAETGTIFLASGEDNPTTLAFLPEMHFILVEQKNIVGSYEEGFDRMRALYGEGKLPRSLNLISGPSRTADIEQTIVRGAHGPKHLTVIVLD